MAANESSVYGYLSWSGSRCTTLEEVEAELRGSLMPQAVAATGSATRSYDANGNTTASTATSAYPLIYDDANRLSQVSADGLGSRSDYRYTYNGLGQRTAKSSPTAETETLYDEAGLRLSDSHWTLDCGSSESLTAGGSNAANASNATRGSIATSPCIRLANARTDYIYLDGLPIAVARYAAGSSTAQLSYLETNHLGTPRIAVDASTQAIQWRWDLLTASSGDHLATVLPGGFPLDLRYPRQYFDAETGLHYNYFRDYDPAVGRYVESDPIGLAGGSNVYSYVGSAPLQVVDTLGLQSNGLGCLALGTAGAVVGGLACSPTGPFAVARATGEGVLAGGLIGCGAGLLVPQPAEPTFPEIAESTPVKPWELPYLEKRAYSRFCVGEEDPCSQLKAAINT
ncbi:MAG: RHS repeat-associated core domain-containing protein [Rhodanobacteraceae bacterium]|nr:RHS repeat-associated core domain-containing protein [Rhodanobacteraceae bacterium]